MSPKWATKNGQKPPSSNKAIQVIVAGIFIHFILGVIYTWGNISSYIISYMRIVKGLNVTQQDGGYVLSGIFSGQAFGMVVGGFLESSFGPRITVWLGGSILSFGTFISTFLLGSFFGFVITYGLLFGFGMGICYTAPISCALRWMPEKKGLISGLITASLGASALIFNQIHTRYINSESLSPIPYSHSSEAYFEDIDLLSRIQPLLFYSSFLYLAVVWMAGTFLVNPTVQREEETIPLAAESMEDMALRPSFFHTSLQTEQNLTLNEALRTSRFALLWVIFFLNGVAITFVAANWKSAPGSRLFSDASLSMIGSIGSICNAGGRITWGEIGDTLTFKRGMFYLTVLWSLSLFAWAFLAHLHHLLFACIVCLNFFCFGGNFALFPPLTCIAYGKKHLGPIYGAIFFSQLAASNLSSYITQILGASIGTSGLCCLYGITLAFSALLQLTLGQNLNKVCSMKIESDDKFDL